MKLTFTITRQDYSDFNKFHFIQTKLKRTVVSILIVVLALQWILNKDHFDWSSSIFSSVVGIGVAAFSIYRGLNKTGKIPEQGGAILGEKEIEFTEEKISYQTKHSQGSSNWSSIKNLKESKHAFYLYMDSNMAMLIPKRAFHDINETDTFRQLVLRKINPDLVN